jgi:hypothetical protein
MPKSDTSRRMPLSAGSRKGGARKS